jgi:penicillin-binding protein 2
MSVGTYLDGRPTEERSPMRFLVFGMAVVLGASVLTARLFTLQVSSGGHYAALSEINRTVVQAIPSTRGLVYDRNGTVLVTNVASYAVKLRPADLPNDRRPEVVSRLATLLGMTEAEINVAIDSNPGSRYDLVRVASDVDPSVAAFISESRLDLPGVEVTIEARRQYQTGPLLSQILGYTGPVNADELAALKPEGYLPDDFIGKAGVESVYETQLRGEYGVQNVERDAAGRKLQVLQTLKEPIAGDSLRLTIDLHEQELAQKALKWGLDTIGSRRGVIIVMNPQTGEILAMVSLPTYDDNLFAQGISNADFQKLVTDKDKPLTNHAVAMQYAPGSTFKLVTGTGGLGDKKITPNTRLITKGYLTLGGTRFYEWNHRGWGPCTIMCGFAHSSDTFFFQVAGMLGIDRLNYWARQYGFDQKTGVDLPNEVPGSIPSNQWKMEKFGAPVYPGETYQAGIGQGYDVVTPLQLINAYAALANGGTLYKPRIVRDILGPDGSVVQSFQPEVLNKLPVPASVLKTMREAARNVVVVRHTYNLVDLPIVVAGKSGTAEFGTRDEKGRLPYSTFFIGFVPKVATLDKKNDPQGFKAIGRTDSDLVVLAFMYDSRTLGNAATEVAKYYLQLHYGISKDYRKFNLLKRANFYGQD